MDRASAFTEMPDGLDRDERRAYIRGYARGCMTYAKKFAAPTATLELPEDGDPEQEAKLRAEFRDMLRDDTVAYEWQRQPSAHKAGLSELRKWRKITATYMEARMAA